MWVCQKWAKSAASFMDGPSTHVSWSQNVQRSHPPSTHYKHV